MIDVPSFTGDEQPMAELMASLYEELGLQVQWQQVEDGRPTALGTWVGNGGGETVRFNGPSDAPYAGRGPWAAGRQAGKVAEATGGLRGYAEALLKLGCVQAEVEGEDGIVRTGGGAQGGGQHKKNERQLVGPPQPTHDAPELNMA